MPIYEEASPEVYELARAVMHRFDRHQPLLDVSVTIQYLFASPSLDSYGQPSGNAISHHGSRALALAKILNPIDRLITRCQARILLDRPHWESATDNQRMAVLDHELYHLIVNPNGSGDDQKPLLLTRDHDFYAGWFHCVARDWGSDSIEIQQANQLLTDTKNLYTQTFLAFTSKQPAVAQCESPRSRERGAD